jgi:hypothetical protein
VYYFATINPRKQDNMARDRYLQSSTGVRDENYANKHRIHISERVTHVSISVYLDIVQVIRQHDVQVHPLSTETHPYRLCEYDTATGEYACILYREDALNFLHSYNVRGPGTQEDFILWLVDSGTTSFLSNLLSHMFIQIPCHTTINGVGQAVCDTCSPLILHCISEDEPTSASTVSMYTTYHT